MHFFSSCFIVLLAFASASAQFVPAWNIEPSMFPQARPIEEPGLFNFIPAANPMHNIFRPPTPLGWGKKK